MYCRCGAKCKPTKKVPAPQDWQAKEAWVCEVCNKISHAVQEPVRVMRGPKNAAHMLHAKGKADGTWLLTWKMPDGSRVDTLTYNPYPRKIPMSHTEPLLYLAWNLLMKEIEIVMRPLPEGSVADNDIQKVERNAAKLRARGMCEMLAILMKPFLSTGDEVARAAMKKHKNPDYEVPGLGEHLWDPTKNMDGSSRNTIAAPKKRTPVKVTASKPVVNNKSVKKLTEEEQQGVRSAVESQMFTKEEVASMFKVSLAEVESALR